MNKEQQELLDEAYNNYLRNCLDRKWMKEIFYSDGSSNHHLYLQEEFINKCKTDTEFSERWGLKIEERELTYSERYKIWFTNNFETGMEYCEDVKPHFNNEYYEPTSTKLITVTYNDKTIESYV
jgi:hypothetical protein